MHEGAVSAELGLARLAVGRRERSMVERDLALAGVRAAAAAPDAPLGRASPSSALARAQARASPASGEVTPHHLCLTDEAVRSLDPNLKMNPPLRAEERPRGADRGAPRRHDRCDRDRPRAARAAREGRAVRGGAVRRHRARDRVRGALHAPRRARACCRSRRCSSGCPPGPARVFGLPAPRIAVGAPANLVAARPRRELARRARARSARARSTRGCSASGCAARCG